MTRVTSKLRRKLHKRPLTRPGVQRDHVEHFDAVVCFGGEDWWYHNRGHYDMQMMRELSAHVPVLYVNSIGMRLPRVGAGRMFFRRVARKLRSLARGLAEVRPNFTVFSPTSPPAASAAPGAGASSPGRSASP